MYKELQLKEWPCGLEIIGQDGESVLIRCPDDVYAVIESLERYTEVMSEGGS